MDRVSEPVSVVIVRVPAKINIHLGVGTLRPDGFHELDTVFHAIDLFDVIRAAPADRLLLAVDGPESSELPLDCRNLAWRAAELLAQHAGIRPRVSLTIHKAIPVAAGLAGGSADAAATLLACDRLWALNTGARRLAHLSGQLGSDVAFALHGRTARGTGRGDVVTAVPAAAQFHWVIASALGQLSTPEVYAELDRQRSRATGQPPIGAPDAVVAALTTGDPYLLAPALGNDLAPAAIALAPYLIETLAAGHRLGALAGIVSGSGPSCAFLASSREHAVRLAESLDKSGTCRFAIPVMGGVPGATVQTNDFSHIGRQ
jgi:4-diphosphocytidyl-2-C-methyl-D-erythritol kinase